MELKQKQVLIMIWILGNPKCLRSVANQFHITKSILLRVYRRICEAIANNLSGQYMEYLLVWNWAPHQYPYFQLEEVRHFQAYSILPKNTMQCSNVRDQNWTA